MTTEATVLFWIGAVVMGVLGIIGLIMLIFGIVFIVKNVKAIKRKNAEGLSTTGNIVGIVLLSIMSFAGVIWGILFTAGGIGFLVVGLGFLAA